MDHSKSSNMTSFTPITNDRSSTITYGDGYVYTGPLSAQQYEIQSKTSNDTSKQTTPQSDGQHLTSSSSPSITNLSLSSSPSTEIVCSNNTNTNTANQYQFKVMLLGDSGVGKFTFFIYLFS